MADPIARTVLYSSLVSIVKKLNQHIIIECLAGKRVKTMGGKHNKANFYRFVDFVQILK